MEGKAGSGILATSGKTTCTSQALMHRNPIGKRALVQEMNIPVCFSEHTNNSEQLIPQGLTAINISLMALSQ